MPNEIAAGTNALNWQAKQVYGMAVVCLVVGLALGYFFRGSQSLPVPQQPAEGGKTAAMSGGMPSLDQMRHMAEKKADPLLAQLKANPNDAKVMVQIADIYKQTHQFKDAADYYQRALKIDPSNAGVRSDFASVLYYSGDVDGALAELREALQRDPKNAAALFNLGMVKYQGKKDSTGAIAAWEDLLKTNPQLDANRKAAVQKLIAQAKQAPKQ